MIPSKLIEAVVIFVLLTAAAGQLPRLTKTLRIAQIRVLSESLSSNWSKQYLPTRKR